MAVGFLAAFGVVRLDLVGAGFLRVGQLRRGGVGQALGQRQRGVELSLCAVARQLFAAGACLRFGAEQQVVAGADGAVLVGA